MNILDPNETRAAALNPPQIEMRDVQSLLPYAQNARTHSLAQIEQIAASIREFGWTNPVLIDGRGGIVAGHGRVRAAQLLGIVAVPCICLSHLNEAQRRAYILADNQLALRAGWDEELLRLELSELDAIGYELPVIGFSTDELEEFLRLAVPLDGMPILPSGDRGEFQQMTFTLHDSQAERVCAAMAIAAAMGSYGDSPNQNMNGNALARICEKFLAHYGNHR